MALMMPKRAPRPSHAPAAANNVRTGTRQDASMSATASGGISTVSTVAGVEGTDTGDAVITFARSPDGYSKAVGVGGGGGGLALSTRARRLDRPAAGFF